MLPKERKVEVNPFIAGGVIVGIIAIILLVISLKEIFHKNPYGPETKIDNIEIVDKNLPRDQKEQVFANLYTVLGYNLGGEEPPKDGALVRERTVEYGYDEATKIYAGSFVVDVAEVEQSFQVQLSWSPEKNNPNLGGYPILITCVPKSLRIYEGQTGCIDSLVRELSWQNAYQLDYTFGATTSQRIRQALNKALIQGDEDLDELLATVDEMSLTRLREQPDYTYRYDVELKGEKYQITTRVDETYGNEYIIIYIDGVTGKQGIVLTDEEERAEELSGWLRSLSGRADLSITMGKLEFGRVEE